MSLIERLAKAAEKNHGIQLQPLQLQELMYLFRGLIDENKYFIDRVEILEQMALDNGLIIREEDEIEGQETLDTQDQEYVAEAEASGTYSETV